MPQNCRLELRENADKINIRVIEANKHIRKVAFELI